MFAWNLKKKNAKYSGSCIHLIELGEPAINMYTP